LIANVLDITASATTSLIPEQVIRAAADYDERDVTRDGTRLTFVRDPAHTSRTAG
jgi:hypothetical protein